MSATALEQALQTFRAADRAMGAERRKDDKGLPTDKAAAAQAKHQAAQEVRDAAAVLAKADLSERQRRDVKRALDYLRLSTQAKRPGRGDGAG